METISVNKQLLQEERRGAEKSDTDLARRQESRWLSSEAGIIRNIYVQQNTTHFWVFITLFEPSTVPHPGCKQLKWHNFYNIFPGFLCLSFPLKLFSPSLSLWQVSHLRARKEADIPNFRYSPDLFAFYLPGICRFQNRIFSGSNSLQTPTLKKNNPKRRKPNRLHSLLEVAFKFGFKILCYPVS